MHNVKDSSITISKDADDIGEEVKRY